MKVKPDLIAKVRFMSSEEGGREGPTPPDKLACILEFEGENFDCFLLLDEVGILQPGDEASIPIKLLYPQYLRGRLSVGSRFILKDYRVIGTGEIQFLYK